MSDTKKTEIKIVYGDGESGWAVDLGDGTARIANIPLTDGLNIDDVVRLELTEDGRRRAGDVVSSVFPIKASIYYDKGAPFGKFRTAMHAIGCKVEGFIAPTAERRGWAMVACKEGTDVYGIARAHGLRNPEIEDAAHARLH